MARYQLRRPSPVKIIPRRVRRQEAVASSAPAAPEQPEAEEPEEEEEEEEEEGPESPDSPDSSGSESSDSDSDSEDEQEPPSPAESGAPAEQGALPPPSESNGTTITSAATSAPSQTGAVLPPPFTLSFSSQGNLGAVPPQVTDPATSTVPASPTDLASSSGVTSAIDAASSTFITQPTTASISTGVIFVSSSLQAPIVPVPTSLSASATVPTAQPTSVADGTSPSTNIPLPPAQSETAGQEAAPQKSAPQEEKTMISKGGVAAAISLSVIGAIAILVAVVVCMKRRKRRQNQYSQRLDDDAFNPNNTGSLHAPETAHVGLDPPFFGGGGSHLTRSTDRSDSLFGAAAYQRPETVSTDRNKSRFPVAPPQPTPNPFADPPLNKAYDVLAGRPRSTTLTDRGSWVKNPFRNPESERFDPFGELQEKAREERRRYLEESRKEAEDARLKEVERQFGMKEAMGLGMPEQARKGSGATVGGLGVLDRSGGTR